MKTGIERAKELFMQYSGNHFYMDLNGDGHEYDAYRIPRETEEEWRREYMSQFFEQKRYGREALLSYAHATDFLKSDISDDCWERVLYYPLRTDWLDDVTILFMLPVSYQLAERQTENGKFSWDTAEEYMQSLDGFIQDALKRAEAGTLTRAEDYHLQEFSDEVYVASYLKDLQQKWIRLSLKLKK